VGTGKQARCWTIVRHMHVCSLLIISCWLHSHIWACACMCCYTCFHQDVSHSLPWIYFGQFPKAWYTSRRSFPPLLLATIPLIRCLRLFSNITPTVATELPAVYSAGSPSNCIKGAITASYAFRICMKDGLPNRADAQSRPCSPLQRKQDECRVLWQGADNHLCADQM